MDDFADAITRRFPPHVLHQADAACHFHYYSEDMLLLIDCLQDK